MPTIQMQSLHMCMCYDVLYPNTSSAICQLKWKDFAFKCNETLYICSSSSYYDYFIKMPDPADVDTALKKMSEIQPFWNI